MATKTKKTTKKAFDFRTIKTFEDACKKLGLDPLSLPALTGEFLKPIIAAYKLMVIYKAVNDGWVPDWGNDNQNKYYPWFWVLSSGFGFSASDFHFGYARTDVGSRLCTNTSEKARYMAEQFENEYREYFLYSE
jgi:hypothetical protein